VLLFWSALSRLPDSAAAYTRAGLRPKLTVLPTSRVGGDLDVRLPRADVCFFKLSLPAYSTPDILRRKLRQLLNNAEAMTMDGDEQRH
jgi:hypothetical protein